MIRSDRGEQKIKLSLAPGGAVATGNDLDGTPGEKGDVGAPEPGTVVESATVKRVDEATGNVQVTLPGGVPGVVTAAQMSDHPLTGAGLSRRSRRVTRSARSWRWRRNPVARSSHEKRPSWEAARGGTLPEDISGVVVGAIYPVTSRPQPLTPEFSSDSLAVSPVLHPLAAHRRPSRWRR